MENREEIRKAIKYLTFHCLPANESTNLYKAVMLAISALKKQEESCDTCRHKSESFNGRRCGDCSVGYPDRYEAETNFEVTSKNFEPYTEEEFEEDRDER